MTSGIEANLSGADFLQPSDLFFDRFTDEGCPFLFSDQRIDPLAQTLRQANYRRFHSEWRPSHTRSLSDEEGRAIETRITDIGY
ncbi:hypothetical protein IAG41_05495 [Sphingomonas sp. JC676]|uniref:hypothetical protein n=1 Tax=Sphingomonas sp. JC676 TaxID=2768065 RepID=UPI0016586AB4|nr:hypothetical protein [Sphingomonas sp. JC676]MBC9031838.1 hypothetical protein [Sphingomonas sp. JC676]